MNFEKFADCFVVIILFFTLFFNAFTSTDLNATGVAYLFELLEFVVKLWFTGIVATGSWHYLKLKHGDN